MSRRILFLTPYPMRHPRHGGQVRAAAAMAAAAAAGWTVRSLGIYPGEFFDRPEREESDLVLGDAAHARAALDDQLFGDLIVAQGAAGDPAVQAGLAAALEGFDPQVVVLEQPWCWLPLSRVWPARNPPRLVYASHNIEWRMRPPMFGMGLRRPGAEARVEAVRALEEEVLTRADLILSISDIEAEELSRWSGKPVVYVPPVSTLADAPAPTAEGRFGEEAAAAGVRYAALIASAYWPNIHGFLSVFPEGLGPLPLGDQVWVAGRAGKAIHADVRYQAFLSTNEARFRDLGFIADEERAPFLGASACGILPIFQGGGAKLKTADIVASGRPVIATATALEGYHSLLGEAVGGGIYVEDDVRRFRALLRAGLAGELSPVPEAVRRRLGTARLAATMGEALAGLLPADRDGTAGT